MIKLIDHNNIDKAKWDKCVNNSSNKIVYAYSWYLDIVTNNKWSGLIFDDYIAVMPIMPRKKLTINYLCQPILTQQGGIFSENIIDNELIITFLNYIKNKYSLIEIMLNYGNNIKKSYFSERINIILPLNDKLEKIRKNYSENTKRNIKKAEKAELEVLTDYNFEKIFRIFSENKGLKLGISNKWYNEVKRITNYLHKIDVGKTIIASNNNGEIVCGIFYVLYEKRIYILFSGTNEKGKKTGAMHYLIDKLIELNIMKCDILDFEGSNNENLARFYKSFGAIEQNYPFYRINNLAKIMKLILRKK